MNKFLALLFFYFLSGCRGYESPDPPIHLNRNMFIQEKGKSYKASDFFDDGYYMRLAIPGTIARGELKDDEHFYFGLVNNKPAEFLPKNLTLDQDFLKKG